jgi:hypothetical protein
MNILGRQIIAKGLGARETKPAVAIVCNRSITKSVSVF